MIDCISIATSHHFPGNILADQHALRYREVIQKEDWENIYTMDGMEFDQYDNLATEYYVARNDAGQVVGVTRAYPTTIPYMLSEKFAFLFSGSLPSHPKILEASRLVLDRDLLTKEQRRPVIDRLVLAYMERGLQRGIDGYVGFMLPKIWDSTFLRTGWDVEWLGPERRLPNGTDIVRAAFMPVNEAANRRIRAAIGIQDSILNFGASPVPHALGTTVYSHMREKTLKAA